MIQGLWRICEVSQTRVGTKVARTTYINRHNINYEWNINIDTLNFEILRLNGYCPVTQMIKNLNERSKIHLGI